MDTTYGYHVMDNVSKLNINNAKDTRSPIKPM